MGRGEDGGGKSAGGESANRRGRGEQQQRARTIRFTKKERTEEDMKSFKIQAEEAVFGRMSPAQI